MGNQKIAVISGGASGMGAATAKLLVNKKCKVYILDINIGKEIDENYIYMECDVSCYTDVISKVDIIKETEGRVDYLFTCAGIHLNGYLDEINFEQFDRIMKTNVYGAFYVIKEVIPLMKKNKQGSIVLMGSDQSIIAKFKNSIYGATKGAIAQLSKGLAVDYADFNIRVNCVCPGTIDTPMFQNAANTYANLYNLPVESIIEESKNAQPIKRIGTADEVAKVVEFLLSDASSYITGASISVDGGFTSI